jgi:putative ABC transport system permease protein
MCSHPYNFRAGGVAMSNILQDLRYGLRMLVKSPGFTALAVIALALGIGANTAVFSVANAFLRKPVALPNLDRLAIVLSLPPQETIIWSPVSPADYLDWKAQSRSFEKIAVWKYADVNLTGTDQPEKLVAGFVSANFFDTVGVMPAAGRPFRPEEEQPGHDREAILSNGLWQRRFASDPAIVGKTIVLDGKRYDIVGVTGKEFTFPVGAEIWLPLALKPEEETLRSSRFLMPTVRLKPGVSRTHVRAEMSTIEGRISKQFPQTDSNWNVKVLPLGTFVSGELSNQYCLLLIGAVIFVMLIACANVANLLFARAASRHKEIAVRQALGAGRFRIVRQLLTESLLLATLGAVFGLVLGQIGIGLLRYYMPPDMEKYLPMWKHVQLESDVFWYTVLVALLAGIISGIAPAFQTSRSDIHDALKEGGRGNSEGRDRQRLRTIFVVSEVALSLILLVGAGLMSKGVRTLLVVNQNLQPQSLLTMHISLPESKYKTSPQRVSFFDQALEKLNAIPGVQAALVATEIPYGSEEVDNAVTIQGRPARPGEFRNANIENVNPDYFRALHIPLRDGRLLQESDSLDQPFVVVVSQSFAQRIFPGEDPIGKYIKIGPDDPKSPWVKIVGIVGDIKYTVFSNQVAPPIYLSYRQAPVLYTYLAIRTERDPAAFAAAVRSQIASIDPDLPVSEFFSLEKVFSDAVLGLSYVAVMLTVMGVVALVLASVGVYGVMAYSVAERTQEIGVRVAMGAQPRDVLHLIMSRGIKITCFGLLIGLPLAWGLAQLMASLLYGVSAGDVTTFASITVLMCIITLLACYVPTRKAMSVDPIVALRHE